MIRDIVFHPLGFACSAVWFFFALWLVAKAWKFFFPPRPPEAG